MNVIGVLENLEIICEAIDARLDLAKSESDSETYICGGIHPELKDAICEIKAVLGAGDLISKMARALIDLHNNLPYSSGEGLADLPEDKSLEEHWREEYENLLTECWNIANRFSSDSLEAHTGSLTNQTNHP